MELDYSRILNDDEFCKTVTVYHVMRPCGRGFESYVRSVLHNCFWESSQTLYMGFGPNGQKIKYPKTARELLLYIRMQDSALQTGGVYTKFPFVPGDFITLGETPDVSSISELRYLSYSGYCDEGLFRVKTTRAFYNSRGAFTNLFGALCV